MYTELPQDVNQHFLIHSFNRKKRSLLKTEVYKTNNYSQ